MGSAVIYDRIHLLTRKLVRLRHEHGHTIGIEKFVEEHGQSVLDEVYEYLVACSSDDAFESAKKQGYPEGTVVIPLSRRK